MELHGEGDQDQVSIRSLPTFADVSGSTSLAYAGGEGIQHHSSHTHCLLRNKLSVLIMASTGPDEVATSGPAAVMPKCCMSVAAGEKMINRPVTETDESPGAKRFISAFQSKGNMSEHGGGQKVSQIQADALGNKKKQERTPTKRPPLIGSSEEDKSILKSHGATQGDNMEKSQDGQGQGSSSKGYTSLSSTQKESKWVAGSLSSFCWLQFVISFSNAFYSGVCCELG